MGYGLIGTVILILDIIAIFRLLSGPGTSGYKILWLLVIIFLPLIGMILYFAIGRKGA